MKRIISLCCVALIFVFSLAAPAQASDISNNQFLNLLDFSVPNGQSDNSFYFTGTSGSLVYPFPSGSVVWYVELLISSSLTPTLSVAPTYADQVFPLTVSYIGDGLYRAYGSVSGWYMNEIKLNISYSSVNGNGSILRFNIGTVQTDHFDIDSYTQISADGTEWGPYENQTIHYRPSDELNYRYWLGPTDYLNNFCVLQSWSNEWQKYDYIDFLYRIELSSVNTVSATCGDVILPVYVNEFEVSSAVNNTFILNVRVDLTGLDRTSTDVPTVVISCSQKTNAENNSVEVYGSVGHVIVTNGNVLTTYFNMLRSWIQAQTASIVYAINGDISSGNQFQQDVQQEIDRLDEQQVVLDSVTKPALSDIDVNMDQYVSQSDIQVLAQPLTVIFDSPIFSKIIIMSILLATVSYTLYGKK